MKKVLLIILAAIAIFFIVLAIRGANYDGIIAGRDTVRLFKRGHYQLSRCSSFYAFNSMGRAIELLGITHYYEGESAIYLIGNDNRDGRTDDSVEIHNFYARIDTVDNTAEVHDSITEFGHDDQLIFSERRFVELRKLPPRKTPRP